ncbi:RIP metalloprotease RseP [Desulfobacterales bacterium HSG16]|nr:RIP metalloprotease RseP [Desulfobacterales bacterium HSG16]
MTDFLSQTGNFFFMLCAFLLVLGPLVFFHEFGHFIAARLCGVGVEVFSIGFGPRLFGKKRGRTDYRISAVPLGGYVKMTGDDFTAEIEPEDIPYSFVHAHVAKRMLIAVAGPAFNMLLAFFIFSALLLYSGSYEYLPDPVIGEVRKDSPAKAAGLQKGDRILSINGEKVKTWKEMSNLITTSTQGTELSISVLRKESEVDIHVTPEKISEKNHLGETIERYIIGITASGREVRLGPIQAIAQGFTVTFEITRISIVGIIKMIEGKVSVKENLGGPIIIAKVSGDVARKGIAKLMEWGALLSISLAILNIMPIPILDGGHLLFCLIEILIRRPVSIKIREVATQAGFFLLLMLVVFVFYNDIARILN